MDEMIMPEHEVDPEHEAELDKEIEKDLQDWEEMKEWNEATAEHDKEWFAEWEKEHGIEKKDEGEPSGPGTETQPKQAISQEHEEELDKEIEKDLKDWEEMKEWTDFTAEHDKEWFAEWEKEHGVEPQEPAPHPTPTVDWTGEGGGIGEGEEPTAPTPTSVPVPTTPLSQPTTAPVAPVSAPVFAPIATPSSPSSEWEWTPTTTTTETIECSGIVGTMECQYKQHEMIIMAVLAFVPVLVICLLRKCCCKPSKDTRGEYRAVAAQYGDYDNTFSDDYSDEEDDDFVNGNGDIEDDSWGKSGKRTIEMSNLGHEQNGGLSLEEMNG